MDDKMMPPFEVGNKVAAGRGPRNAGGRVREATNNLSFKTIQEVADVVADPSECIARCIAGRGLLEACEKGLSGWRNRISVIEQTAGKAMVRVEAVHTVDASARLAALMSKCGVQADVVPQLGVAVPIVAEVLGEREKGEGVPGDSGVPLGPHTGVPAVLYAEATDGIDADEETGPDEDSLHE